MGLGIDVGNLAFSIKHNYADGIAVLREHFNAINAHLRREGLPEHHEPEVLPELHSRAEAMHFQYFNLPYLRRIYAHAHQDPEWIATPVPPGGDPRDKAVEDELCVFMTSHLICHSDSDGYYVPVDFPYMLYSDDLPAHILGSSYRLQEELQVAARPLGITLDNGRLSDQEAARINALARADGPFVREYGIWLALFEAARLSITHGTAIKFG